MGANNTENKTKSQYFEKINAEILPCKKDNEYANWVNHYNESFEINSAENLNRKKYLESIVSKSPQLHLEVSIISN